MPNVRGIRSWPTSSAAPRRRAARAPSRASSCCAHGWEAEQLGPGGCHPQRGTLCLWSAAELAGAAGAEQGSNSAGSWSRTLTSCPWVTASPTTSITALAWKVACGRSTPSRLATGWKHSSSPEMTGLANSRSTASTPPTPRRCCVAGVCPGRRSGGSAPRPSDRRQPLDLSRAAHTALTRTARGLLVAAVALDVVAGLVLVDRLGVLAGPPIDVTLGVVRVPGAAVVAARLVLGELDPMALDVVGGALFVAAHAQLLSAGTVPC